MGEKNPRRGMKWKTLKLLRLRDLREKKFFPEQRLWSSLSSLPFFSFSFSLFFFVFVFSLYNGFRTASPRLVSRSISFSCRFLSLNFTSILILILIFRSFIQILISLNPPSLLKLNITTSAWWDPSLSGLHVDS